MRLVTCLVLLLFFLGCKKDKFTSEPQISYVSLTPNVWQTGLTIIDKEFAPKLKLKLTDAEGDVGFKAGSDTSWIFIRRTGNTAWDSLRLPVIGFTGKSFEAEIEMNLYEMMRYGNCPTGGADIDTLKFELYLRDFAKNKSNIITTPDPVYFICR